jgi:hypothetical protein
MVEVAVGDPIMMGYLILFLQLTWITVVFQWRIKFEDVIKFKVQATG